MSVPAILLLSFLLPAAHGAFADIVTLQNGDQLSGVVVSQGKPPKGDINLRVSKHGYMLLNWSEVAGVQKQAPKENGKLLSAWEKEPIEEEMPQTLNPPEPPPAAPPSARKPQLVPIEDDAFEADDFGPDGFIVISPAPVFIEGRFHRHFRGFHHFHHLHRGFQFGFGDGFRFTGFNPAFTGTNPMFTGSNIQFTPPSSSSRVGTFIAPIGTKSR